MSSCSQMEVLIHNSTLWRHERLEGMVEVSNGFENRG